MKLWYIYTVEYIHRAKEEWNLQDSGYNWKVILDEVTYAQKKQTPPILLPTWGPTFRSFCAYA